jgi:hypothetical protein
LNWIVIFDETANKGVANLVISNQPFAASIRKRMTFKSGDDPVNGIIDFGKTDGFLSATGSEDGRFIEEVGKVSTCKSRCPAGNAFQRQLWIELFVA